MSLLVWKQHPVPGIADYLETPGNRLYFVFSVSTQKAYEDKLLSYFSV